MRLLRMQKAASLATCTCAFAVRDEPNNQTSTAQWDPTQIQPSWMGTTEAEVATEGPMFRPRPSEVAVDGFETTWFGSSTSVKRNVPDGRVPASEKPDVGSLIESILNTAKPPAISSAIVHFEKSEDGWGEITPSAAVPSDVQHLPVVEVTVDGLGSARTGGVPPNNLPQATLVSGVVLQVTDPPVAPIPQVTPPPVIIQSGVTLQPVPVTSVRVLTVDGKPITVSSVVNYRYMVGTAALLMGTPTTINNVVVAMSIDSSGSTVLVVGDQTTTLLPPAQAVQAAQATSVMQVVKISTTVVEGTTKYIIASQTLAPGQAITVNGVPITITVTNQATILIVGDVTTTVTSGKVTSTTTEWGASAAATFGGGSGNGINQASATSVGAGGSRTRSRILTDMVGLAVLLRTFA